MQRFQTTIWTLTAIWLLVLLTGCQQGKPAAPPNTEQESNVNGDANEDSLATIGSLNTQQEPIEPGELQNRPASEIKEETTSEANEVETNFDEATFNLGAIAYQQGMCAKCHDESGAGTPRGPDLTDALWEHGDGSYESIRDVLITGVPKSKLLDTNRPYAMNPATNLIKHEDAISALATYVESLGKCP